VWDSLIFRHSAVRVVLLQTCKDVGSVHKLIYPLFRLDTSTATAVINIIHLFDWQRCLLCS
jgi:hypothetical protein